MENPVEDTKRFWAENKHAILLTIACATAAMLVIKLFDLVLVWGVPVAVAVGAVLLWRHFARRAGGSEALLKSLLSKIGVE